MEYLSAALLGGKERFSKLGVIKNNTEKKGDECSRGFVLARATSCLPTLPPPHPHPHTLPFSSLEAGPNSGNQVLKGAFRVRGKVFGPEQGGGGRREREGVSLCHCEGGAH